MADYQLTATDAAVIRTEDQASIPNDPDNRDWMDYQTWLDQGHIPDPYVAPLVPEPAPPADTTQDVVLFDHENRLRTIEGKPPLTPEEFKAQQAPSSS